MSGPCGWTVTGDCSCASGQCWSKANPATQERATALAAHFLWAATGRRYGPCEVTVQPCTPAPPEALYQEYGLPGSSGTGPYIVDGVWHNASGCYGAAGGCVIGCVLALDGPVASVVEVLVDGEPLSPDDYRIVNGRLLQRLDGSCWPVDGVEVTYERGVELPAAIQAAFDGLACQIAKACSGSADCQLPPRMRTLTRQGVSIEVATEEAVSQGGKLRTGIKWIDDVIAADNPAALTQPPLVLSLDDPAPSVVSWVGGS